MVMQGEAKALEVQGERDEMAWRMIGCAVVIIGSGWRTHAWVQCTEMVVRINGGAVRVSRDFDGMEDMRGTQ